MAIENDPFFAKGPTTYWNACIGQQSDEESYVDGYIEAALELANTVIKNDLRGKSDVLAMPVLYTARHGIELCLKFVIARLRESKMPLGERPKDHNIDALWRQLASAQLGDSDLRDAVVRLQKFVDSLHAVDNDGQQLRYSETQDGKQSLSDKRICNLQVIHRSLLELRDLLIFMKRRTHQLVRERATGTFTTECSRMDLMRITMLLPTRTHWREPEFATARAEAMRLFGLSSRQFSEVAHVIQQNREMAGLLGIESTLQFLTDEHAFYVIDEWSKMHPPRPNAEDVAVFADVSMESLVEFTAIEKAVVDNVLKVLSLDEIADLRTVFYIGRERWYCEVYRRELEDAQRLLALPEGLRSTTEHILAKTNLVEDFAHGLDILGRRQFASRVRSHRPDLFSKTPGQSRAQIVSA